jgi:hypothetical protein
MKVTGKAASREIIFRFPEDFQQQDDSESGWKVSGDALEAALKSAKVQRRFNNKR